MRVVVGLMLMADAAVTEVWFAGHVPVIDTYDAVAVVIMIAAAIAGAVLFMTARLLLQRRPGAAVLGTASILASAVLTTLQLGCRLAPANVVPSLRGPLVVAYWIYAFLVIWCLRRVGARAPGPRARP
jgi:hypothetical protein